jgi:hypothetical protein
MVFEATSSRSSDQVVHAQAGMPNLMQYLWAAYGKHVEARLAELNHNAYSAEEVLAGVRAAHFVNWASRFLDENRPVQTFAADANVGLRLSNNDAVVVSPGTEAQGSMPDARAVGVTHGQSQPGLHGTIRSGEIQI